MGIFLYFLFCWNPCVSTSLYSIISLFAKRIPCSLSYIWLISQILDYAEKTAKLMILHTCKSSVMQRGDNAIFHLCSKELFSSQIVVFKYQPKIPFARAGY